MNSTIFIKKGLRIVLKELSPYSLNLFLSFSSIKYIKNEINNNENACDMILKNTIYFKVKDITPTEEKMMEFYQEMYDGIMEKIAPTPNEEQLKEYIKNFSQNLEIGNLTSPYMINYIQPENAMKIEDFEFYIKSVNYINSVFSLKVKDFWIYQSRIMRDIITNKI